MQISPYHEHHNVNQKNPSFHRFELRFSATICNNNFFNYISFFKYLEKNRDELNKHPLNKNHLPDKLSSSYNLYSLALLTNVELSSVSQFIKIVKLQNKIRCENSPCIKTKVSPALCIISECSNCNLAYSMSKFLGPRNPSHA